MSRRRTWAALAVVLLAMPLATQAQKAAGTQTQRSTYCCSDEHGRQICSDVLPQSCWSRAYREIDGRGLTVRRVEAPLTPEQIAQREAEARRKREQERLAREERKRNQALLDAYSNERDIDLVRDRSLADIQKSLNQASERYAEAAKRQKDLSNEMEFYRRKPAPKELLDSIRDNESELRANGSVVEAKQKELDGTRAKFDEEKRRYVELTRGQNSAPGPAPVPPRR
jgi:hypothetical protein